MNIFIIIAIIGVVVGGAAYFVLRKRKSSGGTGVVGPAPGGGWVQQYGNVSVSSDGNFTFGEPHYITKSAPRLSPGQTITLRFRIDGAGEFVPCDPAEGPPCDVSLYMQKAGDNGLQLYGRWFGKARAILGAAQEYSVSSKLVVDEWGPVGGGLTDPRAPEEGFADCLANAAVVGFTFGGEFFAGHGVKVKPGSGTASFTLLEYSIA